MLAPKTIDLRMASPIASVSDYLLQLLQDMCSLGKVMVPCSSSSAHLVGAGAVVLVEAGLQAGGDVEVGSHVHGLLLAPVHVPDAHQSIDDIVENTQYIKTWTLDTSLYTCSAVPVFMQLACAGLC